VAAIRVTATTYLRVEGGLTLTGRLHAIATHARHALSGGWPLCGHTTIAATKLARRLATAALASESERLAAGDQMTTYNQTGTGVCSWASTSSATAIKLLPFQPGDEERRAA
jgi:hypothetical protein